MTLPLPKLDTRSFDQLVAEGRSLIPRFAPRWTDHNAHDPGVTLLELFAWLTEMTFYRLDRVSESSYRAFLRLVGVTQARARAAETVLVFEHTGGAAVALPRGLQVGDAAGASVFQTTRRLDVIPSRLVTVLCGRGGRLEDRTAENAAREPFEPFGADAGPGSALYLGFDAAPPSSPAEVSLHVWAGAPASDRETRRRLVLEERDARRDARLLSGVAGPSDVPRWDEHYAARTTWEYYTADGDWRPLARVFDRTRALTLGGPVRFNVPAEPAPGVWSNNQFFVRCRLTSGGYEDPPRLRAVVLNAAPARHAADAGAEEFVGASNGRAGQVFQARRAPVVPGSTRLRVLTRDGEEEGEWHETAEWDLVTPHERAFRLSPVDGALSFGDGRAGRVPPSGAQIFVNYRTGGGEAGNVAAGQLEQPLAGAHNAALVPDWEAVRPALRVRQPFAAEGGSSPETLPAAKGRAVAALSAPSRAVTLADYEALALSTPGVPVARARALADFHPSLPCLTAPGALTVVVVPAGRTSRPEPRPEMLDAVARHLRRRRLLTTEVYVTGPRYTSVTVHARLHAGPHADARDLVARARRSLDEFFHPLRGGPGGAGWPVGRDVYRAEVLALLSELPGVSSVDAFGLETEGDDEPRCDNLPVSRDSLLAPGIHQIQVIERSNAR